MDPSAVRLIRVYRLTTYVPASHAERLVAAMSAAAPTPAGSRYDRVLWRCTAWQEQFRPLPGSQASAGEIGKIADLPSVRIEICLPHDRDLLARVIAEAIRPNHPWESPVIQVDEPLITADGWCADHPGTEPYAATPPLSDPGVGGTRCR
jgi:hypothetical protein